MYSGEALRMYLRGHKDFDIEKIDFSVYVYPDDCICSDIRKDKSDCVKQENGSYLCTFEPSLTSEFLLCDYTIEIHDRTNNIIFVKKHAFHVEASATSRDIRENEEGTGDTGE